MDKILLSPITLDELVDQFRTVVKEELGNRQQEAIGERFLSPSETCKMFQPSISKPTLSSWVKSERLTEHRIGSRVFFKHSEVVEAVTRLKRYKRLST